MNDAITNAATITKEPLLCEAEIYGDIETEAQGLAYGAMIFTVKPGCTTALHHHTSEETWIIQAGEGYALINGRRIGLIPGANICVPPGAMHSITSTSTTELRVLAFWWRQAVQQ